MSWLLHGRAAFATRVLLDERHQYSIWAFTYRDKPQGLIQSLLSSARSTSIGDGAVGPISTHIVHQLLADLRLDRLAFRHTMTDTAIVAKEVDKGTGLAALRDWVSAKDAETIVVGDDEPDLAMFRVATRSFAPANIGPRRQARLLGCQIVSCRDQQGLLEIVRKSYTLTIGIVSGAARARGFHVTRATYFFLCCRRRIKGGSRICAGRCYTQPLLDSFFARHSHRGPPTT